MNKYENGAGICMDIPGIIRACGEALKNIYESLNQKT
jgi:hypothetical protein